MAASVVFNEDCVEVMKRYPDGYFDLAVVDPPYGAGGGSFASGTRFGGRLDKYKSTPPEGRTPRV